MEWYINFLLFITYSSNFQFSSVYMLRTRHNFGQIDSTFENCDILKNLFQRNSLLSSNKRESLLTKFPLCSITISTQLSESKSQSWWPKAHGFVVIFRPRVQLVPIIPKGSFLNPKRSIVVTSGDYDYLSTWLRIPNIPLLISHFNSHVSWNVM